MLEANLDELLTEVKKLHPEIPQLTVQRVNDFLYSNLNQQELTPANCKKECEDLIKSLKEAREKNED
jgi:hypothetical protein